MSSQHEDLCDFTTESIQANSYVSCPSPENPRGTAQQVIVKDPAAAGDPPQRKEFIHEVFCDQNDVLVFAIQEYNEEDGTLGPVQYLDGPGGAAVTPVLPLKKASDSSDFEYKELKLCDDNGEFIRCLVYENGATTPTSTFDIDPLGNAYTPVGTVVAPASPDTELVDLWIVNKGANGSVLEQWFASAEGGASTTEPMSEGFTAGVDRCNRPVHSSAPDTIINPHTSISTISTNLGNVPDQQHVFGWVEITSDQIRLAGSGLAAKALYMKPACGGKIVKLDEIEATTSDIVIDVKPGFYYAEIFVHDPTQAGQGALQQRNAAGNFAAVPDTQVYLEKPSIEQVKALFNKKTGEYTLRDGSALPTGEIYECDPCGIELSDSEQVSLDSVDYERVQVKLCDDNGVFFRQFIYLGGELQPELTQDINPDGSNHVNAGTEQAVDDQCYLLDVYEVSSPGDGVTHQSWEGADAISGNNTILGGFGSVDECGLYVHENAPTAEVVHTQAGTINVSNPGLYDQARAFGYIVVPAPGKYLHTLTTGATTSAIFLAGKNEKLSHVFTNDSNATQGQTNLGYFAPGIYRFDAFNNDPGTNGAVRLRWSDNGTTVTEIPVTALSTIAPTISKRKAIYSKKNNTFSPIDGGAAFVDPLCYDPCDTSVAGAVVPNPNGSVSGQRKLRALNRDLATGSYSTNATTTSVTACFIEEGVTVTDIDGNVVTYPAGISKTWSSDGESDCLTPLTFNATTGRVILAETEVQ